MYAAKGEDVGKVSISNDYGSYGGARILKLSTNQMYFTSMCYEIVDNKLFIHSSSQYFSVYKDSQFYTLENAYINQVISSQSITELYKNYYNFEEEKVDKQMIEHDFNIGKYTNSSGILTNYENIQIEYGKINSSYVVLFDYEFHLGKLTSSHEEKVADYTFKYNNEATLKVWNDHKIYDLNEAYNLKLLSEDDIKILYDIHQAKYVNVYC